MVINKKVCLLGDFAVGKTSLVRRYIYDLFDETYLSTIGVKVSRKTMILPYKDEVTELALMLWDIAGNNGFHEIRTSYLRGAAGAVLVCDLTRPNTLESLQSYVDDLRALNPKAALIVAANKLDLVSEQQVSKDEVVAMAQTLGTTAHFTSARMGSGVEELFRSLGQLLLH